MMTFEQAHQEVLKLVDGMSKRLDLELAIDEAATRTEPWCWVFFYNSRAFLEAGSSSHALAGNGPVVVDRATGQLHELTTARTIEVQLEEIELQRVKERHHG